MAKKRSDYKYRLSDFTPFFIGLYKYGKRVMQSEEVADLKTLKRYRRLVGYNVLLILGGAGIGVWKGLEALLK
jgi:hypothetical protein